MAFPETRGATAAPRRAEILLEVEHLSIEYHTAGVVNKAVTDLSFHVASGEVVSIVGDSGSGKSTAILGVLGLARRGGFITSGNVKLEGQELLALDEEQWRKVRGNQVGLVTQNPRGALNPVMRVGDQIAKIYKAHRQATDEQARERALELLRMVGINDPERRLKAFPHELSGGMAQRIVIAMALSCTPKLLIADEPTTGLDVTVQAQVLDDLRHAANEVGSSLLLVTHDLGIVANYCDRVYLMHAGELVEVARTETFFESPAHPVSAALLSAQRGIVDERFRLRGFPIDGRRLPSGCWLHPRCPFALTDAGCMTEHPPLYEVNSGHVSRCHRFTTVLDTFGEVPARDTVHIEVPLDAPFHAETTEG
jgi:oligopeptide/dipeptide ABC transporter ATP-binding protein